MKTKRRNKLVHSEILRVDCPEFLVNSSHEARRYETADGAELRPGHYLAVWPAGACRSSYGSELRYLGPHPTAAAARMLQVSAQWLGIVEPEPQTEAAAIDPQSPGHPCHVRDTPVVRDFGARDRPATPAHGSLFGGSLLGGWLPDLLTESGSGLSNP